MPTRAPFTHSSSSINLVSTETVSNSDYHLKHQNTSQWNGRLSMHESQKPELSSSHSSSNGHHQNYTSSRLGLDRREAYNGLLSTPTPFFRSTHMPTPPRSPSPSSNPFALPSIRSPALETIRFVSLCILWYSSSAVSSNTGKVILNNFRFPVTLTIVQFFFVAACCWVFSRLGWSALLRNPSRAILRGTLPMAAFQVGGHIFSSLAISRVPVSTVHTIKALSPLFTVLAYALLFGVSYSAPTYLSLLPLTAGVMLATSVDISLSNVFGLICAFGSTLVFVSQNIFFKKIMPTNSTESNTSGKLDKINLLFFSSGTAFVLMIPLWFYSDAKRIWNFAAPPNSPSLLFYFFINGTVHFGQNLLAFAILSSTSPVTYSIASLVKRIAVICLAIVWFKQAVHPVQAIGICLTAVGLWMYNNAKRDVEKGEQRMRQVEAVREGMLPLSVEDQRLLDGDSKLIHNSPKPNYSPGYLPSSKTSGIQGFQLPPPLQPRPVVRENLKDQHNPESINNAVINPPAVTAPRTAGARHRRLSLDRPDNTGVSMPSIPSVINEQPQTLLAA